MFSFFFFGEKILFTMFSTINRTNIEHFRYMIIRVIGLELINPIGIRQEASVNMCPCLTSSQF